MLKQSVTNSRQVLDYLEAFEPGKVLPTATARDRSPFSLEGDLVVAHPSNIAAAIWPGLPREEASVASVQVSGVLKSLGGIRRRDLHGYTFGRGQV